MTGAAAEASWSGSIASTSELQDRLRAIALRLARGAAGSTIWRAQPTVMSLVIAGTDRVSCARAALVAEQVAAHHPSRTVVLVQRDAAGNRAPHLTAALKASSRNLESAVNVVFEQVWIDVRGAHGDLAGLVDPVLTADAPVVVEVVTPGISQAALWPLLDIASMVIVDSSAGWEEGALDALLGRAGRRAGDLAWARLRPWRSALAACFEPEGRRRLLRGDLRLRVTHAAGSAEAGRLLAGWVVGRLRESGLLVDAELAEAPGGTGVQSLELRLERGSVRVALEGDSVTAVHRGHAVARATVRQGDAGALMDLLGDASPDLAYLAARATGKRLS